MFGGMGGANMSALLDSPAVQSMLGDENFMQTMLENNPQIRQLTERNPEIAQALRNPAMLREAMNAMRSPAAFAEMQRNTDRAMLNIENHPEGYRLLEQLHRQMDSINDLSDMSSSSSGQDTAAQEPTRAPDVTQNSSALPNPWASRGTPAPFLAHLPLSSSNWLLIQPPCLPFHTQIALSPFLPSSSRFCFQYPTFTNPFAFSNLLLIKIPHDLEHFGVKIVLLLAHLPCSGTYQ